MLTDLCHEFISRGVPLGSESPEEKTLGAFGVDLALFAGGQTVDVVRRSISFCPDPDKEILYAVAVSIWLVPLYVVCSFSGILFMQFGHTLAEYFEEMAEEVAERNAQIHQKNATVKELIKKGLPRR